MDQLKNCIYHPKVYDDDGGGYMIKVMMMTTLMKTNKKI